MTEDLIEQYEKFNTKGCPDEQIFGGFNDQPIPSDHYKYLNDDYNYCNNIPGNPVDDVLPDNKGVEDELVPNDEDINNEITIDEDDSLALEI